MKRLVVLIAVLSLVSAGCADDSRSSEEFAELEQRLAAAEQQAEELLADQDGPSAPAGGDRARALATIGTERPSSSSTVPLIPSAASRSQPRPSRSVT